MCRKKAKSTPEQLIQTRYVLVLQGYVNKKELAQFLDCGYKKACVVWEELQEEILRSGKKPLFGDVVMIDRVLARSGLTKKSVVDDYIHIKKDVNSLPA